MTSFKFSNNYFYIFEAGYLFKLFEIDKKFNILVAECKHD